MPQHDRKAVSPQLKVVVTRRRTAPFQQLSEETLVDLRLVGKPAPAEIVHFPLDAETALREEVAT
jgi:hypothetical protein